MRLFFLLLNAEEPVRHEPGRMAFLVVLLSLVFPSVRAETDDPAEEGVPLYVAFSAGMFPETNKSDAKAAIKAWSDTLAITKGIHVKAETEVYDRLSLLQKALALGKADLVSIRIDEYLEGLDQWLEPSFVGLRGKWATEEFVLITRRSAVGRSLEQLKDSTLTVLNSARTGMARIWLDTVLLENGLQESATFFSEVKQVGKVSKAVLPVFFGQMAACLVTRSGFRTMVDLNPQVGRQLTILRSSPPVLPSLMCMSRSYSHPNKEQIEEAISELHLDTKGQQVLMLFGIDRLVPCTGQVLATARKILQRHQQLKTSGSKTSSDSFGSSRRVGSVGANRR